jgi:hypothetical protein
MLSGGKLCEEVGCPLLVFIHMCSTQSTGLMKGMVKDVLAFREDTSGVEAVNVIKGVSVGGASVKGPCM